MSASTHGTPASGYGTGSLRLAAVFLLLLLGGLHCYFSAVCSCYVSARSSCYVSGRSTNLRSRRTFPTELTSWIPPAPGRQIVRNVKNWLIVCLFVCLFVYPFDRLRMDLMYKFYSFMFFWPTAQGIAPRKDDIFFFYMYFDQTKGFCRCRPQLSGLIKKLIQCWCNLHTNMCGNI